MNISKKEFYGVACNVFGSEIVDRTFQSLPAGETVNINLALGAIAQAKIALQKPTPNPAIIHFKSRNCPDPDDSPLEGV